MARTIASILFAFLLAACAPDPSPTATLGPSLPSSEAAALTVTGSGKLCAQWYMGCGAFFAVEAPNWSLPEGWTPAADDTRFDVVLSTRDRPTRVTGVTDPAMDRVPPGEYLFIVIVTTSPDNEPEGTLHPAVGCSDAVSITAGTEVVSVEVRFVLSGGCALTVEMGAATPGPSP